jgi:peptide/nickel transport system substrate-binding protein
MAEAGPARRVQASLLVTPLSAGIDPSRLSAAVSEALAAAGISVTVRDEPGETALRVAQSGEHQMVIAEAEVAGGDPHLLLYPLSTSEGATKGLGALNFSFYRNARLDDLLIRASQLSFRPERQRVYARAQALLADEIPWVPLYARRCWAVARPEVRNLRLHPSCVPRLDRVVLEPSPQTPAAPRP